MTKRTAPSPRKRTSGPTINGSDRGSCDRVSSSYDTGTTVSVDPFVSVPTLVELSTQGLAWPAADGRWGVSFAGHALLGERMRHNGCWSARLEAYRRPLLSRNLPNPGQVER